MGASSSSAFWVDKSYDHSKKELTAIYESMDNIRIVKDVQFTIEEAKNLLDKKNLYPEITLILDIDFTLGQAASIRYDNVDGFLLEDKKVDLLEIQRIVEEGKATWFHNKTFLFFIRPYFKEFIQFCDQNFKEVIIWTNGVQRHADNMVSLVEQTIGKKWRGFGRDFSTYDRKIVTNIGLDPATTWLVDDDHRHHYISKDNDVTKDVNPDIKFFHIPEFSMTWFPDLNIKIPLWGKELEVYDDWFMFLIWNWNYMNENHIEIKKFIRLERRFSWTTKVSANQVQTQPTENINEEEDKYKIVY